MRWMSIWIRCGRSSLVLKNNNMSENELEMLRNDC